MTEEQSIARARTLKAMALADYITKWYKRVLRNLKRNGGHTSLTLVDMVASMNQEQWDKMAADAGQRSPSEVTQTIVRAILEHRAK